MAKRQKGLVPIAAPKKSLAVVQPLEEARDAFMSENTRRGYARDWMDFFEVNDVREITLERAQAVTSDDVTRFRDRLVNAELKPSTIARKLASVRSFFARLVIKRSIPFNPAHPKLVQAPKRGEVKKMDALTQAEIRTFLGAIDRSTRLGRRDYAVIMTDLHMGLRRSEALSIRIEQFKTYEDRACVLLRSKGQKERIVWINQDLEKALAEYSKDRGQEPGFLFRGRGGKGHLSGDQFWRIVKKHLEAAGIVKRVGTHGLRASFITINIEKGTPLSEIQKTVGHSRPDTTLGYARDLEMVKSRAPKAMEGLSGDKK